MDFWDLVKVMWRRWYVTAPMLLLTAAGGIGVLVSVGPEYQATGHVAVVPPEVQRLPASGQVTRVNPWNEQALAHAATIRLQSKQQADQLVAAGYGGEWTVEMTGTLPVLTIEVVAPTAEQATETMRRLQSVIEEEVQARQAEYNIAQEERIMTVRYDQGESIDTTASRLRRALVAVVGAGLVFTAGMVVAYDALARWRQNRRAPLDPQPAAATGTGAEEPPRRRYEFALREPAGSGAPTNGTPSGPPPGIDFPLPVKLPTSATRPATDTVTIPVDQFSPVVTEAGAPPAGTERATDDSTVVIPLANQAPWAGRPNGDRAAGGNHGRSGESQTP